MIDSEAFLAAIAAGYQFDAPSVELGAAMHGDATHPQARVRVPRSMELDPR